MASIEEILKDLEGAVAPEALKALEERLSGAVKASEQAFIQAAEEKYGVAPAVVSDAVKVVEDVAPAAAKAAESLLPPDIIALIRNQASQLEALQAQIDALKTGAANQTTAVMGQGEPVNHTLFLEDGTVVTNHGGLATHYSVDNGDGTSTTKRVVAAYPTA